MSVTSTACASGVRSDAPGRVHVRLRRARLAASAPARGGARVPGRVSSVATKHHGIARGGSAFAAKNTAGRGAPLRGARVPTAACASAADAECEPPRRADDMDSSAGGRSAGSRLEGSLEDVGDVAGATPAASNAHVPTGRSAFVLAFGLAFAAAACYFMSAHTKVGAAVYEALSRSGFTAAFALIFVSELGDKTFFIAALLAMRLGRFTALAGAVSALSLMSVISVVIGRAFQSIPSGFNDSLPLGEYLAVGLLFFFGVRTLKEALDAPDGSGGGAGESGELADAETAVNDFANSQKKKEKSFLGKFWETFCLVFIAEWGDRSMLATIALGAAQNPVGVAAGACFGHLVATLIAVVGGALLSQRISERQVGIAGGALFIVFAIATLAGVF